MNADTIVRKFGYKPTERGQADQTITAVRLITDICSKDQGTKVLADALYIYSSTWPVVYANSRILEALVRYLSDRTRPRSCLGTVSTTPCGGCRGPPLSGPAQLRKYVPGPARPDRVQLLPAGRHQAIGKRYYKD